MHYFFGGKNVIFFRGMFFVFFWNILHCYVPCKKNHVFILTFAVFFLEFRWDFQHGIPWEGSHLLCFWSMCFRKWPPPKKKKRPAPANPQPTPNPQKKPTWPMLCWLGERKSKSNWTSPAKLLPDPTGHERTKFHKNSLHSLETNSESFRLPLKMIGKMKTYEFTTILGKYTPKTNTSPPKNRGGPLGISFFGGESPHFPVRMGC